MMAGMVFTLGCQVREKNSGAIGTFLSCEGDTCRVKIGPEELPFPTADLEYATDSPGGYASKAER